MLNTRAGDDGFELVFGLLADAHLTRFEQFAGPFQTRLQSVDARQVEGELAVEPGPFANVEADQPACSQCVRGRASDSSPNPSSATAAERQ